MKCKIDGCDRECRYMEQQVFGQKLTHRGKKANGYQPKYGEYQQKLKDLRDSRREAA